MHNNHRSQRIGSYSKPFTLAVLPDSYH